MIIRITTMSGTLYTIDTDKRTWKRERNPEATQPGFESAIFETCEGTYVQTYFESGECLRIVSAPEPGHFDDYMVITSTPVINITGSDPVPALATRNNNDHEQDGA